jgi:D-serine deaminase-like pyridoxal phosphate-dependent protein
MSIESVPIDDLEQLPTPHVRIDLSIARANIERVAQYGAEHGLAIRPHTKTHKSLVMAQLQSRAGAIGLTVAKVGELEALVDATDDWLIAYPILDPARSRRAARLAHERTIRVGVDSIEAIDAVAAAACQEGTTLGILVDLDVGHHRTGVASPAAALRLARHVSTTHGVRFDGLMCFPGHLVPSNGDMAEGVRAYDAVLGEAIERLVGDGLPPPIVSGGSTPTFRYSHLAEHLTEIRPGTSIYNDRNTLLWGEAELSQCAARVVATVVSTAVAGKAVIDAGSKTLAADLCGADPSAGFGQVLAMGDRRAEGEESELQGVRISRLTEEHGELEIPPELPVPPLGSRVEILPNHICPCINLHDRVVLVEAPGKARWMPIDARGRLS